MRTVGWILTMGAAWWLFNAAPAYRANDTLRMMRLMVFGWALVAAMWIAILLMRLTGWKP